MSRLKVLFQDRDFLAIHKPAGMPVYGDPARPNEPDCTRLLGDQLRRPVFPVHRLDKPTCGILLFAFSSENAARLQRHFSSQRVLKIYEAIACGELETRGSMTFALAGNKEKEKKPARTDFFVKKSSAVLVDEEPGASPRKFYYVELSPQTGRYHQIRRHLKLQGAPIIGDTEYGKSVLNDRLKAKFGIRRLGLSATRLELPHPVSGKLIRIVTTPDADFLSALKALNLA